MEEQNPRLVFDQSNILLPIYHWKVSNCIRMQCIIYVFSCKLSGGVILQIFIDADVFLPQLIEPIKLICVNHDK